MHPIPHLVAGPLPVLLTLKWSYSVKHMMDCAVKFDIGVDDTKVEMCHVLCE